MMKTYLLFAVVEEEGVITMVPVEVDEAVEDTVVDRVMEVRLY